MRKTSLLLAFFLIIVSLSTALDFNIRDNCNTGEVELFSISNTTNAHAGFPDAYRNYQDTSTGEDGKLVCGSGIDSTEIVGECDKFENPVLSFFNPSSDRTHLSPVDERNEFILCSGDLATSVWKKCPGDSEPLVSIYDQVENHVAVPGFYKWQICGAVFESAELAYNFTMSGNTDFIVDGEIVSGSNKSRSESFPVYSAVQNDSLITGIVGTDTFPQNTSFRDGNVFSLRHSYEVPNRLRWFVPLTTGSIYDIENRLNMINNANFLNQFNPNFAFEIAEEILVKVTLQLSEIDIVNSFELGSGLHRLLLENIGLNSKGKPVVKINRTG